MSNNPKMVKTEIPNTGQKKEKRFSVKRPVPNYDGRENATENPFFILPKIILYPFYLTNEYVIRYPLQKGMTYLEKNFVFDKIWDFFTFGTDGKMGAIPTYHFDFGFRQSFGLVAFSNDFPNKRDKLSVKMATGGKNWKLIKIKHSFRPDVKQKNDEGSVWNNLSIYFYFINRPDYVFKGIGNEIDRSTTRFSRKTVKGRVKSEWHFGELNGLIGNLSVHKNKFDKGDLHDNEQSIETKYNVINGLIVPGFKDGYTLIDFSLKSIFDTRKQRPYPGNGFRFEMFGLYGADVDEDNIRFLRYGAEISFFFDILGPNRNLAFSQKIMMLENFGEDSIPFTEKTQLGGLESMQAFKEGEILGESSYVASLQYTYPIWVWIDSWIFTEVGNVFDHQLKGFDFKKMVGSFGVGLRSVIDRGTSFMLVFGVGTNRFDEKDISIDNYRFTIGVNKGF